MGEVSVRELRNHGGGVIERVLRGELITITRSGTPVGQLVPMRRAPLTSQELKRRWLNVPTLEARGLRRVLDELVDPSL